MIYSYCCCLFSILQIESHLRHNCTDEQHWLALFMIDVRITTFDLLFSPKYVRLSPNQCSFAVWVYSTNIALRELSSPIFQILQIFFKFWTFFGLFQHNFQFGHFHFNQLRSQLGSHDEALIGHHIYMTEQSHDSFTWRLKSMTYRYMTINYMKSSYMTLYLHKQHLHDGSLV